MIAYLLSKLITMVYGLLYPAYCSYKAVKTKDVKEYVNWMMYWIVFSIFSFFEVFADTFIGCWFPFYYELKIMFMVWMLSPTTRGGSILYRRLIHPSLTRHEPEIDAYLAEIKIRTSNFVVQWSSRAFSYVSETVMTTILRIKPESEEEISRFYGPNLIIPALARPIRTPALSPVPETPGGLPIVQGDNGFFINKVAKSYSYENIDQPDMNRNRRSATREPSTNEMFEDSDYFPSNEQNQRNRNAYSLEKMRYGSSDRMEISGDESDSQQLPKVRASSRKKTEVQQFTMPPTRSTRNKKSSK